ncbi:uncharacterized protein LACBIDRAFT_308073 [Laccaria bicolor S238N-H82]|uniref:Predicted protein n=1 Tax=Laccaria bicolor (strain S238N-H82 / ATCC MYA-4686) TaxID=486041 RepID=B0DRK7_LACBS|nr:uncharacterized protein LACBIDRAFT_308073 [Laccaria bicolor S238N-H82]EDR02887.1 predicted protein [Laccaria bicolor S238N-H82]|eukprot:XP_001886597.1 predicted protein [Laccaria bicolor S238N-H82]
MHTYSSSYRPAPDSRVTSTRRSSATGYLAKPCVDSRMIARLPTFEIQSHRIVQIGEDAWELWSPNSKQLPFLPGLLEDHFQIDLAGRRSDRRSDGHLGRFDACVSPQYPTGHPCWAPYVRQAPPSTTGYPEFACILDVTDQRSSVRPQYINELLRRNDHLDARINELRANSSRNPSISLEDVWRRYSPTFSRDDINSLRSIRSFDKALDDISQLQRKFKLKAAWIDWVAQQQATTSWSRSSNRAPDMADEFYMGVWINGEYEDDIDSFLAHRIPCFISHKLRGDELDRLFDAGYGRRDTTFVQGTPIEKLSHPHNRVEAFLRKQQVIITESDNDDNIATEEPSDPPESLAASFSLIHREWSRGGPAPIAYIASPPAGQTVQPASTSTSSPFSDLDFSNCGAEPLDMVEIDPCRVAWIRPPPVMRPIGGKWAKWAEKNVDGELFVAKVGKSYRDFDGVSYFDRSCNREVILLSAAQILPGAVSKPEVFGLPCPRYLHFVETPQNKAPRPAKASAWLYLTKDPIPTDVGLRAGHPAAEDLPLKDEFRAGPSNRPPSPPPSPGNPPGNPLPPLPLMTDPFNSPEHMGVPDSERPISPVDSLMGAPPEVDWELDSDEPMGPQIPARSLEDFEMEAVDLGDVPSPPRSPASQSPIQPFSETLASPPRPMATPIPLRHQPIMSPPAPPSAPEPSRQSPPRRSSRKHARQRSPSPPPRRRGDSYRPRPPSYSRGIDRSNPWSTTAATNMWPVPSDLQNPWAQTSGTNAWSAPNTFSAGPTPPPWGASPGYMPWGTNPTTMAPWSVHYPGYYPSEHVHMPSWPPYGFPPVPAHSCPSCHNCASCGRPSVQASDDNLREPPPDTVAPSLLGRLRSPSGGGPSQAPSITPPIPSLSLAQRLRNPATLADRLQPPTSLTQRIQPPSDFVQGSSSQPLQSSLPFLPAVAPTGRARRSRRAGRAQKEEDDRRAKEGKPPSGKGKRRDRR